MGTAITYTTRLLLLLLTVALVVLIAAISHVAGHLTDTAVVVAPAQFSTATAVEQPATVSL